MLQQIQHAENLIVWHDPEAQPAPESYVFYLHGKRYAMGRKENESSQALWLRVLSSIQDARYHATRNTELNPQALVTCYAGSLERHSLAKLDRKHMREHILERLGTIGNAKHRYRGDAVASVKALELLAVMAGVIAPRKTRARVVKDRSAAPTLTGAITRNTPQQL